MARKLAILPPYPASATPGDFVWIDWWKKLQDYMKSITDSAKYTDLSSSTASLFHANVWNGVDAYISFDVYGQVYVQGDLVSFLLYFDTTLANNSVGHPATLTTSTPFQIMTYNQAFPCMIDAMVLENAGGIGNTTTYPYFNLPSWTPSSGRVTIRGSYIPLVAS